MNIGTAARWQAAGLTERQIRTLVAQGQLIQIRHRVYATAELVTRGKADPRKEQALFAFAAILAAPTPGAVASHETAAAIHGLALLNTRRPDVVTLTRPPGNRAGQVHKIRFHSAELIPAHVTKVLGVPVTTVARTVVDVARSTVFREGVVVADAALRQRKTTKDELNTILDQCARWPGIDQARRVVSFSDGLSESPLESCARVTFEERGLEPPELQVVLETSGGDFRVDFYWRKYRTIAEADGLMKYRDHDDGPRRAVAQIQRDQLLRETSRDVVHFTWQQLFYEEDRVITSLTRSFARPRA
jgi:predicted transcriptional regulator of viral defense system/very-short-patch-repair endonuclease